MTVENGRGADLLTTQVCVGRAQLLILKCFTDVKAILFNIFDMNVDSNELASNASTQRLTAMSATPHTQENKGLGWRR